MIGNNNNNTIFIKFSVIWHFEPKLLTCNVMFSFVWESNVGFSIRQFTNTHMWFLIWRQNSTIKSKKHKFNCWHISMSNRHPLYISTCPIVLCNMFSWTKESASTGTGTNVSISKWLIYSCLTEIIVPACVTYWFHKSVSILVFPERVIHEFLNRFCQISTTYTRIQLFHYSKF